MLIKLLSGPLYPMEGRTVILENSSKCLTLCRFAVIFPSKRISGCKPSHQNVPLHTTRFPFLTHLYANRRKHQMMRTHLLMVGESQTSRSILHSQPDPAITSFDGGRASRTLLTTSMRSSVVRYGYSPLEPCTTRPDSTMRIGVRLYFYGYEWQEDFYGYTRW